MLGIALVGAGLRQWVLQPVRRAWLIGAGTLVAAGLIAVYFALAGSRLTVEEKNVSTDDISIAPLILRANAPSGRSERHGKFLIEITSPTRASRSVSTSVGANYPGRRFTLRNGILVIRQYPRCEGSLKE